MFKHILIFSTTLLITCSLIGCSKDKDGTITVYGYASVNGVAYKDYVSIYDAFHPDLPIKPTLFNGDRLGVYNDSIFISNLCLEVFKVKHHYGCLELFVSLKVKSFQIWINLTNYQRI